MAFDWRIRAATVKKWLVFLVLWIALGVLVINLSGLRQFLINTPGPLRRMIVETAFSLFTYGLLLPLIVFIAVKFRFEKNNWYKMLPVHLVTIAVFILLVHFCVRELIDYYATSYFLPPSRPGVMTPGLPPGPGQGPRGLGMGFRRAWLDQMFLVNALQLVWQSVVYYGLVLGITYSFSYYKRYQERELLSLQLETQLAQAQLQALRTQLQPHFLFNTLHTLSSLIYEDVKAADKMISQLSDLLRMTLESAAEHKIPLAREMEFLRLYLEIMQTRFHERLQVQLEIAPETEQALLPNLLLQPLVENSIKHGLEAVAGVGVITIKTVKKGDHIVIEISDNGPGFEGEIDSVLNKGVGLSNTVERLEKIYGASHRFEIKSQPGAGVNIHIELPFNQ